MQIDRALASSIASAAVLEPFRQIEPMRSDRFADWLKKRGLPVGDWQILHLLWNIGLLHPVAIRDVSDDGSTLPIFEMLPQERLVRVGEGWGGNVYADLGVDVSPDAELYDLGTVPSELRDALLWHPFQLWQFLQIHKDLHLHYSWGLVLAGPTQYQASREKLWQMQLYGVRTFGNADLQHSFLRLLAMLLTVEPLVHSWIFSRITLDSVSSDLASYYKWRNSQIGYHALAAAGLTIPDAKDWHFKLSFAADNWDPVVHFRRLFRHADRSAREKLKNEALLAHTLYDTAEILRRYLEVYHWALIPEETDWDFPEQNESISLERFGSARTTNYRRDVYLRIARSFGVDPGYRTHLFLEGETEMSYVRHWAKLAGILLDRAGVRLVNLRGLGNVSTERFDDELRWLRNDEVFPIICVDLDHPNRADKQAEHIKKLKEFEVAGLLPIDFEVWRPNFVEANFTTGEVVEIVNAESVRRGLSLQLAPKDVETVMIYDEHGKPRTHRKTIEDAINQIAYDQTGNRVIRKGAEWGVSLANWSIYHLAPKELATDRGERPITEIFGMALRGKRGDYALTRELTEKSRREQALGYETDRVNERHA